MRHKILILSDSHRREENVRKVIEKMKGSMDLVIFLGDCECSPEVISDIVKCPLEIVRGNCDSMMYGLPVAKIIDIFGHKALITHGHQYGGNPQLLREAGRDNQVEIVMFGHTHVPLVDTSEDVTLLNPGSVARPRQDGHRCTYLVMNIEEDGRLEYVPCFL